MGKVRIQLHDSLNDLAAKKDKGKVLEYEFHGTARAKDALEAVGVPHTEIGELTIDGRTAMLSDAVKGGETIEAFPPEIGAIPANFGHRAKFVADVHLGTLAKYLRMLGFDTLYDNRYEDEEIAVIASGESRIVLTRDKELLKRNEVKAGYWLRSKNPADQLIEVFSRYALYSATKPFTICLECNGTLKPVDKMEVENRLSEKTKRYFDEYAICKTCGKIFWKGSHYENMSRFIKEIVTQDE